MAARSKSSIEMQFEMLLEEYRAIRSATLAMDGRVDTLRQMMVAVFAAIIAVSPSMDVSNNLWLLPMVSTIFSVFGLMLGFSSRQIRLLTQYEALVLRPKIQRFLQEQAKDSSLSVLEWQIYWRSELFRSGFLGTIVGGTQGFATVLFPVGASSGFLVAYFSLIPAPGLGVSNKELPLLLIGLALWLLMLISYIFVGLRPLALKRSGVTLDVLEDDGANKPKSTKKK